MTITAHRIRSVQMLWGDDRIATFSVRTFLAVKSIMSEKLSVIIRSVVVWAGVLNIEQNTGAIVGGVVGGLVAVIVVIGVVIAAILFMKHKKSEQSDGTCKSSECKGDKVSCTAWMGYVCVLSKCMWAIIDCFQNAPKKSSTVPTHWTWRTTPEIMSCDYNKSLGLLARGLKICHYRRISSYLEFNVALLFWLMDPVISIYEVPDVMWNTSFYFEVI